MTDLASLKRSIRRETVDLILAMNPARRAKEDAVLSERFPELPGWRESRNVLLYARAFPEEIDTEPLVRAAFGAGKRVFCPRVDRRAKRLRLFEIQDPDSDFEPGTLGIPEPKSTCVEVSPAEIDWALVPGLAFDSRGYRVGRGAGHYDRLLPAFRRGVLCWAIIYDVQWVAEVPVEPHDVALDGVVSPSRFSRR